MTTANDAGVTRETVLANAELVLPDAVLRGRVTVSGGKITDISEGAAVPPGAEDMGGDYLLPGLVELHTDNLERHIEPRPGVHLPHDAAILAHDGELASCGITTVFDAMRVGSVLSDKGGYAKYARELVSALLDLRAAQALRIRHLIHLRAECCSETLVEEMAEFGPADRIGLVSLMDHTPGQRQFRDIGKLKAYVMGKKSMSEADFVEHVANLKSLRDRFGEVHEAAAVSEARRYGAVLASHDDTTADHVATSGAHGVALAEFPTTVEAAEACRAAGIAIMMGAPNVIRGGSHSGNVSALDLAGAGLLDILSSDYVPSGLLLAAFRLAALWDDLPRAIRTVTAAPAAAANLADRGRIETGLKGDLIRIRLMGGTPVHRGAWVGGQRIA
ncbi:alpha-D-ribose 1-methylphosphonate 5-triphosphate diphosphatase [Anianabacter salinae]|uniref:alpha-D-ribose 1-methylphosphonate 5-triphosphate diphosphatase n=1 Tax=Anianabacter salinae TaxID=2851023 RepID=UPI00225DF38A|nr:alpha-D-ribose 1-methylphosphonate 5-triphosphate diphosphatase [Anianabacter salinae]